MYLFGWQRLIGSSCAVNFIQTFRCQGPCEKLGGCASVQDPVSGLKDSVVWRERQTDTEAVSVGTMCVKHGVSGDTQETPRPVLEIRRSFGRK